MKNIIAHMLIVLLVVSLIGGSLVGCSNSKTTTSGLKESTVLIGTDSPLTGGAAPWGLSTEHGVVLAFDDINAAGGLTIGDTHYTFRVESLDDKFDTTATTNNINQMIYTDGVKFMFTFQDEGTLALASSFTSQKVLNFTVVDNNAIISQPANAYTFRTFCPYEVQADAYFNWLMKNYPNSKSIALITTDNDNGAVLEGVIKNASQSVGLNFLNPILYDPGTTDFTPFVTRLLGEKPDIVSFAGVPTGDAALIAKTLYGQGFKGVEAGDTYAATDLVPIAGQAAMEGFIDTNLPQEAPYVSDVALGLPAREVAKWGTSYGSTWDFYSQAMIMFTAMQRARSVDPTAVKAILEDPTQEWPYVAIAGGVSTFDSPTAQALYGANASHQILNPWAICVIKNGQDTIATIIEPPSK
jgi:branched-chain amino acid transport system substrate-binding protein